jgi:hypothetical protein
LHYWNFEPEKKDGEDMTPKKDQEPSERVVKAEELEKGIHSSPGDTSEDPPSKKVPVFFLDEAHKLPALDSMLYRL